MAKRSDSSVLGVRVTPVCVVLLDRLSERLGINKTATIETIIRRVAREEGIHVSTVSQLAEAEKPIDWKLIRNPSRANVNAALDAMGRIGSQLAEPSDDSFDRDLAYEARD